VTREIAREGRTYEVHLEPMRRGPDVVGVVGVSVDVTDRDRTAATLEELEDALSAQYEGFPIPSYTWRLTGDDLVLVDYNEAGERASAGQVREYLGKRARSVYRDEPEILRDLLRTAAERTTFRREMRYKVPGADERDLSVTYVFAQPDRVVVHIQDLTDRREMEEELAQFQRGLHEIVDGASDAMFILDPWADLIIAANEAAAELLGYRREELLSRHPSDLHREEIGPFLGFMNRVDVSGSGWTDELSCTMKDGRLLRVEIAATRISFHRRRAVVAVIRPIEPGREADPALLEMLSGARER
jgi:PAS domain S-box-containing protein